MEKEWDDENISKEGVEDYTSFISSRAQTLIRIFELLEDDDEGKHWLDTGKYLSQSIKDCASKIFERMVALPK